MDRGSRIVLGGIVTLMAVGGLGSGRLWAQAPLKDTPYFSAMPNYEIYQGEDKEFDAYKFFSGTGCTSVEGHKYFRHYSLKEGAQAASGLQISRNYANAIRAMGGTVVHDGAVEDECAQNAGRHLTIGKVLKGGSEIWVEVVPWSEGEEYGLSVVAKQAMKQDVTAGALFEALNRDGHVALYINFDFGKATIRPDSQGVIDQVAQMLSSNPALKLGVEGHTDNVGAPASNKTLSESRARAVVAALVAKGITAARLTPVGWGHDKPVAPNTTEEGRAKNRRVELVRK